MPTKNKILAKGESQILEFKSTFDKETIETLTAFANTHGGIVLIGVNDNGEISGTDIGKESLQNWQNQIKLNTSPSIYPDIEAIDMLGKQIVKIAVDEHPIKPVSCKGKYYQRKKNANHQMSIVEISDAYMKTFNTSWDFYPDAKHGLEDLSLEKINQFIDRANSIRINPIDDDPFTVLKKFELLKQDKITNGCYRLFMNSESASETIIEAGRFSSDTVIKDSLSIKTDLFSEVTVLLAFIQKHINRGYHFNGSAQREERWEYPMEAIREIVVNMVVHRDYMHPGDSIVKIFDDSIEFFNPGKLPKDLTVEQLKKKNYVSSVRNKQIAVIFKEAGFIEKYGSGIRRVINEFKEHNLKEPLFEDFQHGFRVTIYSTPQKTPQKDPQKESTRSRVLDLLKEKPDLSQREVGNILGVSFETVREHFSKLKKENLIKRAGGRKDGFWEVLER